MNNRILIVDDERDICEILEFNLVNEGYEVTCAYSAEEALEKLDNHALLLLDVMMSGMSGYKLAETLRRNGNQVPIIFLTARGAENDMLTGFSVGADDYISKPFSVKEVMARVKAVLKRSSHQEPASQERSALDFDGLLIDLDAKDAVVKGQLAGLTKTEFELLALMASNPGKIYSRDMFIDILWKDTPYITERTIDVHITRLRKKIGPYATLISSRQGYGYLFNKTYE